MSNPIFVFEGVKDASELVGSDGSATGYPSTNLQDDRYATIWKSDGTAGNGTFYARLAVTRPMYSVLIANHNIASLGITSLEIHYSTNGNSWSLAASVVSYPDPLFIPLVPGTYLYYLRLKFVKTSALSVPAQMGMLYIGVEAQMPLYSNSPERGPESDAIVAESMSKLRYSSSMGADRESWKLDFAKLTAEQAYNFTRLLRAVNGRQYPFWFCDMDGNWHFVRFKKNYLPLIGKGNVIFAAKGIEFDEERVGIAMNLPGGYTIPAAT
jgi:hypothetical protein